jgi:hypothetical protein
MRSHLSRHQRSPAPLQMAILAPADELAFPHPALVMARRKSTAEKVLAQGAANGHKGHTVKFIIGGVYEQGPFIKKFMLQAGKSLASIYRVRE